jgi:hypothetical protein
VSWRYLSSNAATCLLSGDKWGDEDGFKNNLEVTEGGKKLHLTAICPEEPNKKFL